MFENLTAQPADKILQLAQMYREDPRPEKIDLGVGVYKNAEGLTPVMRAVKAAEQQLWQEETTKSYTGLAGDTGYHDVMIDLLFGTTVARENIAAAATPGGTGAVRQALEKAAFFQCCNEAMNAGFRLETKRVLHFIKGRGHPPLIQAVVDEDQQGALLFCQHARLP